MFADLTGIAQNWRGVVLRAVAVFACCAFYALLAAPGVHAAQAVTAGDYPARQAMRQAQKLYDERKYAEARRLVQPLAESGNTDAMFALALMEARGDSGNPDYVKARQWWEKAAAKGHVESEYQMGLVYYRGVQDGGQGGDPAKQNFVKAREWWELAAAHGHGRAMYSLAGMARTGEGQPRNMQASVDWYKKAAELGHLDSQFQLGTMCLNGIGVPKDIPEAKKWFQKAADNKHPAAINALRILKAQGL